MDSTTTNLLANSLSGQNSNKYLTFFVGDETYAISILKIKEILEYGKVTSVPKMPKFLRGAINLRGRVVPIVDLATLLTGDKSQTTRKTCMVIVELSLESGTTDVGLMIDAVSQVQDIDSHNIEEAPSFGGKINTDYISGMGKTEDSFVILLNVDSILSLEEITKITETPEIQLDPDAGEDSAPSDA